MALIWTVKMNALLYTAVLSGYILVASGTTVSYIYDGLTAVPAGMDPTITILMLGYNDITRVEADAFTAINLASTIQLENNAIHFIDDAAFSPCPSLWILNLHGNNLIVPPASTFDNVELLTLNSNPEIYIPYEYFLRFPNLGWLEIKFLTLTTTTPLFPPSLAALETWGTPLETLVDLSTLSNLVWLFVQADFIHCDWAMCWMLFETFDLTSRPGYIKPGGAGTYDAYNALDGSECASPPNFAGLRVDSLSPMELACYDNAVYVHHFEKVWFPIGGNGTVQFALDWIMRADKIILRSFASRSRIECGVYCLEDVSCLAIQTEKQNGTTTCYFLDLSA